MENNLEILSHLHKETDPIKIIEALQKFFTKIYTESTGTDILALYSTASMLKAMGLNEYSVLAIKRAIRSMVAGNYNQYPSTWEQTRVSLNSLLPHDQLEPIEKK